MVIEIPDRLARAKTTTQTLGNNVFGAGLSGASGHRNHPPGPSFAKKRGFFLKGEIGARNKKSRRALAGRAAPRRYCTTRQHLRHKRMAIMKFAFNGKK